MNDDLATGTSVRTKKPTREPTDFTAEALAERKWEQQGEVVERSDSHGVCYKVRHADGTSAWYCRRELQRTDVHEYTAAERAEFIEKMDALVGVYYNRAALIGVHAFIEFAGLMGEFVKVCAEAESRGIDFTFANTHSGQVLPFEHWNAAYLAEKLNCIYGPALLSKEANRRQFIDVLFDGAYKLVPADPVEVQQPATFDEDAAE